MKNFESDIESDMRELQGWMFKTAKSFIWIWAVAAVLGLASLAGIIWFIFWCANYFFGN